MAKQLYQALTTFWYGGTTRNPKSPPFHVEPEHAVAMETIGSIKAIRMADDKKPAGATAAKPDAASIEKDLQAGTNYKTRDLGAGSKNANHGTRKAP